jgi:4-hydroxy-tetrahydrodipicolinate reductase
MSAIPKIALLGYGTMGKVIESIVDSEHINITDIFDLGNPIIPTVNYAFDVAIDFSIPKAVRANAEAVTVMGKNLVIGTTGWADELGYIKSLADKHDVGIVYGSNFSIGMQLFFRIARVTSQFVSKISDYDVSIHELHHNRKLDSPSGSALEIGRILLEEFDSKEHILSGNAESKIEQSALQITSSRVGDIPGTHTIYYDSAPDTIELTHRARNRTGFAKGALLAAKLIHGKKGCHDFSDLLDEYLLSS